MQNTTTEPESTPRPSADNALQALAEATLHLSRAQDTLSRVTLTLMERETARITRALADLRVVR